VTLARVVAAQTAEPSIAGLLDQVAATCGPYVPDDDTVALLGELRAALGRGASEAAVFERVRLLDGAGHARAAAGILAADPGTAQRPELLLGLAALLLDALEPALGLALAEQVAAEAPRPPDGFSIFRRAHLLVAEGRTALGDREGAHRAYEAVLAYDLDDARARAGLARLGPEAAPPTALDTFVEGTEGLGTTALGGGRYTMVRPVGRGRHAVVYLATDTRVGRPVAIKRMLPPTAFEDPSAARRLAARFLEEAGTLDKIRSPYVVRLYDVLHEARAVVLEYCAGGSLRAALRAGTVGPGDLPALATALREGLAAVAAAGATHRDVKPANVLIRPTRPRFVLADLGLAVPRGRSRDRFGSLRYLAPELRAARVPAGPATDAYAAGVVLLEVALGDAGLPAAFDTPTGPEDARPFVPSDLPPPVAACIRRLLDPVPERRLWSPPA